MDADVVIVGAGPAGTSAAIQLARAGRDVVVVDRVSSHPDAGGVTVDMTAGRDHWYHDLMAGAGATSEPNVSAPIVMTGAVSPMARAMPMMMPVMMPGAEYGRMWSAVVCHLVAPRA